jgi:hypothetical protein
MAMAVPAVGHTMPMSVPAIGMTVDVLPQILQYLRDNGYQPVTIDQMMADQQQG